VATTDILKAARWEINTLFLAGLIDFGPDEGCVRLKSTQVGRKYMLGSTFGNTQQTRLENGKQLFSLNRRRARVN
jgi:hypothetical protein